MASFMYILTSAFFSTLKKEPLCFLSSFASVVSAWCNSGIWAGREVLKKCQDEQQNANLLLQHCKNYIDDYDSESHADNWPYLQFVERNYNCHGSS